MKVPKQLLKDFSNWIKAQVVRARLVEFLHYVSSPSKASKGRGGHNALDYHLTLDASMQAKQTSANCVCEFLENNSNPIYLYQFIKL